MAPVPEQHESLIDRQIRLAAERGAFDDLPGKGKPLPGLTGPDDELWWVRGYVRREGLSPDALLPPSVQLRKEIDRLPESLGALPTERAVRDAVSELNLRIVDYLRAPTPPRLRIGKVDADAAVRRWREGRSAPAEPVPADPAPVPEQPPRRRWWSRRG
ncbi:DUF1992 domain-containing protein [Pseudonocardia lacus]|uniref:DnaJ family domain-containing protein n=1 Tax=Pseudonocardia lacus TaxID=2835865 RepID=UPI0027E2DEF7|nr:DUF1992 domain-containing protein [Pseudonocardia lacus]